MEKTVVLAIGAHPDDIEFMMGGTLLLLHEARAEIWFWNLADGCCGTTTRSRGEIVRIRAREARRAARHCGAKTIRPVAQDLLLFYEEKTIRRVASKVREVRPDIILAPSPRDYMEDHQNASRLAVTAAFARNMKNFITIPCREPINKKVTVYHALPYGLRDAMGMAVIPEFYIDTGSVMAGKKAMLAEHRSQKEWLDRSQGLNAYIDAMSAMSAEVGKMSGVFRYAEGWIKHGHLGFCEPQDDPLRDILRERSSEVK